MNLRYPETLHCPNCRAFAARLDTAEQRARTLRAELIGVTAFCGLLAGACVALCVLL
jgi:hypothetical protein